MAKLSKQDRERRLLAAEARRIRKFMKETGLPALREDIREIEIEAMEQRTKREIFEQAAQLADLVERVQEGDHGAANTGGAAQAAKSIRAYADIFFGRRKRPPGEFMAR